MCIWVLYNTDNWASHDLHWEGGISEGVAVSDHMSKRLFFAFPLSHGYGIPDELPRNGLSLL